LTNGIKESQGLYTPEKQVESIASVYGNLFENRKAEMKQIISNLEAAEAELSNTTNA
jgi:exonuclease VII small subunit